MRKITNYNEFISESKLELLLEAKIKFSDEFITLLNHIESPIVKKMLELEDKEVDVNRNYMTYDIDKEDSVLFYPDDKLQKQEYKIKSDYGSYITLAQSAKDNGYTIGIIGRPDNEQKVSIIKEFTKEELDELVPGNSVSVPIVHIRFENEFGQRECFYNKDGLIRDISKLKTSDTRVGRFVSNFLTKANVDFTHDELDDFIVKYKSELKELKEKFTRFEIVTGEDIKYWYLQDNYESNNKGSLGSSCMRTSKCQSFFDIYTENSEVSMIILKSKNNPDKIIGRALLWNATLINKTEDANIKFMDKIYVNDYSDENFFIKFARNNGFYYKASQDYSDTPIMFDGEKLSDFDSLMKVDVGDNYYRYPYMDTFKYYDESNGILSNDDSSSFDYTLNDTDGGNGSCSTCGGTGEVECSDCSGDGEENCYDCSGSGSNSCNDCDGDGKIECYNCEGVGEIECNNCNGEGQIDCQECDGSGEDGDEECSYCSGSGKEDCSTCDGDGKKDCSTCDGDGTTECEECGGDGDIECSTCYGNGEVECSTCYGRGRHDCPECN